MVKSYKLGLRGKGTLLLGGLILAALLISLTSYWQSRTLVLDKVIEVEQVRLSLLKQELETTLFNHRKNLLSLHDVPPIRAIIRARNNAGVDPESGSTLQQWNSRLQTIFGAFLKTHPEYLQIRYIDASGQELVRVESSREGGVLVVADQQLQDKSGSDYFVETLRLPPGETYYSRVNLNRENGVIQEPHRPTLRLATPIYNQSNKPVALIVINLSIEHLFANVRSGANGVQRNVVDEEGFYIKHSDPGWTFGEDLGTEYRFQIDEPELAEIAGRQDQVMRRHVSAKALDGFQKVYFSPNDPRRYWVLTLAMPEDVVFADSLLALNKILFFGVLTGLLSLLLIGYYLSSKVLTPILTLAAATDRLQAGDLGVRVDERSAQNEFQTLYQAINAFAENQQQSTQLLNAQVAAQTTRLKAVIDNVVDGIITINDRGLIESFNPAASDIFGYTEQQALGQNVKILMPEPFQSQHDHCLQRYLSSGEAKVIGIGREVTGLHKSGRRFPMNLAVGQMDLEGQVMFIGICRDVTEHRAARQQLLESEQRLKLATRGAGIGIWQYDLESGVLEWDEQMFKIYGIKREDFSGAYEAWSNSLHPDQQAESEAALQAAIAGEKEFDLEFIVVWPNGEEHVVEATAVVLRNSAGEAQQLVGVNVDITERKRIDRMKNEFVSTVSHELRTPLTSIKGSLGLIRSGVTGDLTEDMRAMLDIAYNNSDRLVRLINDILDIEKIEAGKMDFRMTAVDLCPLIEEALEAHSGYAEKYWVTYKAELSLKNAVVWADPDRLMQALANLLSNAAKFSPPDSQVDIRISQIDDRFRVEVRDRGEGIPVDFREKIFTKFSQADGSDSRQKGGTGLGLSITHAIIERMGGQLGFESALGLGTTFYFELPASAVKGVPNGEGLGGKVLVCEDEPDIAVILAKILTNAGFSVDLASTSAQALTKLGERDYLAMTLDLRLPDQDGLALLRQLRLQPRNADIPVVVVSLFAEDTLVGLACDDKALASDWQQKPIDAERLVSALQSALSPDSAEGAQVLHVEDDPDVCQVVARLLKGSIKSTDVPSLEEALAKLNQQRFDLILLDLMLPDGRGEELLEHLPMTLNAQTPVVIFSARELQTGTSSTVQSELLKSTTNNDRLLKTIVAALGARQRAAKSAAITTGTDSEYC